MGVGDMTVYFRRHFWACGLSLVLAVFVLGTAGLYLVEKPLRPGLTPLDAGTAVLVFFTGEYGSEPQSGTGKVIAILLLLFGTVAVAAIIGRLASDFITHHKERRMPGNLEHHIVLCNWNDGAGRIIREIHAPVCAPDMPIVVVAETPPAEDTWRGQAEFAGVHFIQADPTVHAVLARAGAGRARSVIILADRSCADPDAQTALIALAVTKLDPAAPARPRIVAEVIDAGKVRHLVDAGVDEWVCANDYGLGIIAQCALYGKLSEVYHQLLTYSEDTNEIYLVSSDRYPAGLAGKTFPELAAFVAGRRETRDPLILLGVKRGERVILNPRPGEFDRLGPDDSLIIMGFNQPDLR
jgi:voltage-gated potassium channel